MGSHLCAYQVSREEHCAVALSQFIDDFRHAELDGKSSLVENQPAYTGDTVFDARLAATVEALCNEAQLTPPEWVFDLSYFLDEPAWAFGVTDPEARQYFESVSLPEFAKRKLYFGDGVISRV